MTVQTAPAAEGRPTTPSGTTTSGGEFLAFTVGTEEYGIGIDAVQEIRCYEPPTRIAGASHEVLGVQNLRGVIVPIVDLRLCFGLHSPAIDSRTAVIVLKVGRREIGVVVDAVSDVVDLGAAQLRPVPSFGAGAATDHFTAIGIVATRTLFLVDVGRLLSSPALGLLDNVLQ